MDHKYVAIQEVRNNPNEPWNLLHLSYNKQLTVKDVDTLQLPNKIGDWNWCIISNRINIREVRNNPNKPWDLYWLSHNKTVTVKDIEDLKLPKSTGSWSWYGITESIDIQEVINNPSKPWSKYGLRNNDGCTGKILEFFNAGLVKHLQRKIGVFKYHTDISIKCE